MVAVVRSRAERAATWSLNEGHLGWLAGAIDRGAGYRTRGRPEPNARTADSRAEGRQVNSGGIERVRKRREKTAPDTWVGAKPRLESTEVRAPCRWGSQRQAFGCRARLVWLLEACASRCEATTTRKERK